MAGDWLKMTHALPEKPEVLAIAGKTRLNRFEVVGRLFTLWRWFDINTTDGNAVGVTSVTLEECLFGYSTDTNFVSEVLAVRWLNETDEGVSVVNFDEHISESAKTRAQTAKRVAKSKSKAKSNAEGNGESVTSSVTKTVPREEKRREEKKEEKAPRRARVSLPDSTLSQYLESCKAESRRPIPEGHPVRAYCEEAGITDEMRQIAWLVFKDRHLNADKTKTYRDWPGAFANSVKGRWYRLWSVNESGSADWTPNGLQEKRVIESRMNKEAEHAPA